MIKAIVFDIGDVLVRERLEDHYPKLAKWWEVKTIDLLNAREKYINDVSTGKISNEQYIESIAREIRVKNLKKFKKDWIKIKTLAMVVDKKITKIIKILSLHGYFIVAFTNILPMHEKIRIKKKIYDNFNCKILSYKAGSYKPQPKFYRILIGRLKSEGILASEAVFIDDKKENLLPAKRLCLKTIHYRDPNRLLKNLRKMGVKL
jgi:HAD superfamily hydrolase (TIGR01509 family)